MNGATMSPFGRRSVAYVIGFAGIGVFLFLVLQAFSGGAVGFGGTQTVEAEFVNGLNLVPRASEVRVSGLTVGQVSSVELENGVVVAGLRIDRDVALKADARARLRAKSLLGEKYVELQPGDARSPLRGRITDTGVGTDVTALTSGNEDAVELGDIEGEAREGARSAAELTEERLGEIERLVDEAAVLSGDLAGDADALLDPLDDVAALTDAWVSAADRMGPVLDTAAMLARRLENLRRRAAVDFARLDTAAKVMLALVDTNRDSIAAAIDRFELILSDAGNMAVLVRNGASVPVSVWGLGDALAADKRRVDGPNPWPEGPPVTLPADTEAPWR